MLAVLCSKVKKKGRRSCDRRPGSEEGRQLGCVLLRDAELFFLFFCDDDPRRDHHHEALGFTPDTHVLEQAVDVGDLVEHGHAELVTAFAQSFDSTEEDGSTVGDAHGCQHVEGGNGRQLNGGAGAGGASRIGVLRIVVRCLLISFSRRAFRGGFGPCERELVHVLDPCKVGDDRHPHEPPVL